MKVCVFAETVAFDVKIYKILCSRILKECFGVTDVQFIEHSFDPQGRGTLLKQVFTEINLQSDIHSDLDVVFIFVDSDNFTSHKQRKKVKQLITEKITSFPHGSVVVAAPKRNIEAWLISDIAAINRVAGTQLRRFPKAERVLDPKEEFSKILSLSGKSEKESIFAARVIDNLNILTLCKRSKSFLTLHEDIRDFMGSFDPTRRHRGHHLI